MLWFFGFLQGFDLVWWEGSDSMWTLAQIITDGAPDDRRRARGQLVKGARVGPPDDRLGLCTQGACRDQHKTAQDARGTAYKGQFSISHSDFIVSN